jgi:hypothetical protein
MKNIIYVFGLIIGLLAFSTAVFLPFDFAKIDLFGYAVLLWLAYQNQSKFWKPMGVLFSNPFACYNTPSRACEDCVTDELNKIVHVALVKRGTPIGTSTISADILTAELAGNAYVIRNVSGAYDGGKGSFGKGLGKQLKRLLSKAHTLTFIDFSYVANTQYWIDMENQASNFDLYFMTDTQAWVVTNAFLSIEAMGKITDANETFIEADISVSWSKKANPLNYTTSVDSLATCQQLFDGTTVSFLNVSGSTGTIVPGVTDEIDLTRSASSLNSRLQTGINLSSVAVVSGTLPTGLLLSYSGPYITLTGTTTQLAGTYTVVIKGANAVGVAGSKTVKFVIS